MKRKPQFMMRTRFAKDIVCEFVQPQKESTKVAIIAAGAPTYPGKRPDFAYFLAEQGYWVFVPRYRGTWESGGEFLKEEPTNDILDVMNGLPKGFSDAWSGERFSVEPSEIVLFAGSFGGPAGILLSQDPRVSAVIGISAVVDWQAPSPAEPLDWLYGFVKEAFGEGYRVSKAAWNKLGKGKFYTPVAHPERIDPTKILLIHAQDDESVTYPSVAKFAKEHGIRLKTYKKGGHFGTSILLKPALWRQVARFIDKRC